MSEKDSQRNTGFILLSFCSLVALMVSVWTAFYVYEKPVERAPSPAVMTLNLGALTEAVKNAYGNDPDLMQKRFLQCIEYVRDMREEGVLVLDQRAIITDPYESQIDVQRLVRAVEQAQGSRP